MFDAPAVAQGIDFAPEVRKAGRSTYDQSVYRLFDIVVSILAIMFTVPLLVMICIAVKFSDGGPVLFGHERIGRGGRHFKCLKFRSMVVDADKRLERHLAENARARAEWAADHKLRNDPRVTALGTFLRRSSLDELPQLFNVLRGEMSIVGPRPIVAAEAVRYRRYLSAYCNVRPGLTGRWQISGRNAVTYRRRVAMDTLYARRKSLALDLQIFVLTVPAVLLAKGAS